MTLLARYLPSILALVLWAVPAQATVDWDEGFEYASDTAMQAVWPSSCLGNPGVSTDLPHSGAKSLKEVFHGHVGADPNAGGCFIDRNLNGTSDRLYTRIWMFMQNFTVDPSVGTKMFLQGAQCCYPSFWWGMPFGAATNGIALQGIYQPDGTYPTVNVYGGSIPQNQWVCVETHLDMGTPGQPNGIVQSWINGVQSINVTNQYMRGTVSTPICAGCAPNTPTANFEFVRLYTQHGWGTIYYDDYAVSRDARIGCGGALPPGDTTAPPVPSLAVVENVSGQATASWNTVTDQGGSGLAGFNLKRCTGAACSPVSTITTPGSSAVSYVDTTVAASTTYGYALNSFDFAGNQSSYTATIYITTNAAAAGAVAIDAVSVSPETANVSTTSWAHTVGAINNRVLLVCTQSRGAVQANQVVSSVNLGGVALTKIRDDEVLVSSNYYHTSLWRLIAPSTGAGTVTVNWAGVPGVYSVGSAASFSNVDQTSPIDAQAGGTGTGTTLSATITTVADNAWIVDCALGQGGIITVGAGQTMRNDRLIVAGGLNDGTGISTVNGKASHGAETMDWTQPVAEAWAMSTVSLKPVAVVTPPRIASLTLDATGANLTYSATTPTQIRISTQVSSIIYNISSFPGGRFTAPGGSWPPGNQADRFVCASAIDSSGVENLSLADKQCGIPPALATIDTAPPVLSNGKPSATLPAGTTSTILSVDVDKPAGCRWALTNIDYDSMALANQMTRLSLTASATISGLTNGSSGVYYVGCTFQDANGVTHNSTNTAVTIAVANSTADTTPPGTVSGLSCSPLSGGTQASCAWPAASGGDVAGYQLLGSTGAGNTNYNVVGQPVAATQIVVSLQPNTVHNFVVIAIDTSGNPSAANSNVSTITTTSNLDLSPPNAMTGMRQESVGRNFAILAWDPCVDDRGSCTAVIEKSPAGCAAFQQQVSQLAERRLFVELAANTTYCFRGKWNDGTNDGPYSAFLELTTTADGFSEPRASIPFGYDRGTPARVDRP